MSVTQQRTDLYNAVNGVSNAGVVYNRYRYQNNWADFLTLFKTTIAGTDQIRGWMLEYKGFQGNDNTQMHYGQLQTHGWTVHGFLGLSDANSTEITFSALVESVIDAIKASTALRNQNTYFDVTPATGEIEIRLFGDVLCHYIQVRVTITEFDA